MSEPTTTQTGTPVASDAHSLTIGADGATVLHDRYLVEKLAQFNRERIPERIVHAKGGGAFGTFEVTADVSAYTRAAVFQPGSNVETLARFSSVAGEQGSPDTWRDVRGFSVKFYTTEGNYDIVGNNTPVFFIRDAIKFPDFIHSQKRLPGSGLRDADMQWDFWTLARVGAPGHLAHGRPRPADVVAPDAGLRVAHLPVDQRRRREALGEVPLPQPSRVSSTSTPTTPRRSPERTPTSTVATSTRPSRRATTRSGPPVQVMPHEDAKTYRFNPFDLTKTWPHADYPLIEVGTMTLDRNPQNFFAQIEQAAFAPANRCPASRSAPTRCCMAACSATPTRSATASAPTTTQMPVNAPHAALCNTYSQDGAMAHNTAPTARSTRRTRRRARLRRRGARRRGRLGERRRAGAPAPTPCARRTTTSARPGTLYREVLDDAARARLLATLRGQGESITVDAIRERFFEYWANVDAGLGAALRAAVDLERAAA